MNRACLPERSLWHVQRDGLAADRADVEADLAAQALEGDAGVLVADHGQAHVGVVDVGEVVVQALVGQAATQGMSSHISQPASRAMK
jgi:hypothetical protein